DGQLEVARRGPRRLRPPRARRGKEIAPVDPVALDQPAHVFAREAGVVGRTLDAAPVAKELGDQVALLERREDALARHAKGKIEILLAARSVLARRRPEAPGTGLDRVAGALDDGGLD